MSTHNLCFVKKYEKYLSFLSENFQFLEIKFSIYLNRRVFVMITKYHICSFVEPDQMLQNVVSFRHSPTSFETH